MIFGFNTDVKYGDTVYHVQSEARRADLLLQTQVFVRGRCIGKKASSYADKINDPNFSDEQMHEMLKNQHRAILDAVRDGKVEDVLRAGAEVQDAGGKGLALQWVNADSVYSDSTVVMRFAVSDSGSAVSGARLTSRLAVSNDAPIYSQAVTDELGAAEMKIFLDESALGNAEVLVQAVHGDKSATRKFRLRRNP